VSNGQYDVVVTLGDTAAAHDEMGVFLEGVQVDTVTTSSGQTIAGTYRVDIGDGQLNLRLVDLGGSYSWVMINALDVIAVSDNELESAAALSFASKLGTTFNDQFQVHAISGKSSTVVLHGSFEKGKALDLLISQLSTSSRFAARDAQHEARDQAMSELFDRPGDREVKRNRFRELQLGDEVVDSN
jgi:hypothetical protein